MYLVWSICRASVIFNPHENENPLLFVQKSFTARDKANNSAIVSKKL